MFRVDKRDACYKRDVIVCLLFQTQLLQHASGNAILSGESEVIVTPIPHSDQPGSSTLKTTCLIHVIIRTWSPDIVASVGHLLILVVLVAREVISGFLLWPSVRYQLNLLYTLSGMCRHEWCSPL